MTSNNGNGRPHGNRLPALPAANSLGGKERSSGSAPAGIGDTVQVQPPAVPLPGSNLQPVEASVSGLELPSAFSMAHFLDPAFLAGIANELYAEVEPGASLNDPEAAGRAGFDNLPAPGEPARQAVAFERFDYADPRLFQGVAEAPIPADGGLGLTDPTPFASPSANEGFYFLTPSVPAEPLPTPAPVAPSSQPFSVEQVRKDFPILQQSVHGKPLIWFDNAATTQKPRQVIDAVSRFYERDNSNIHRAAHTLAARATTLYEDARDKVRRFLGAGQVEEIVFVHGATEAINLVAQTYGRKFFEPGDEIVVSTIEHHANIVPWQQVAREKGAVLRVIPVNDRGEVLLDAYESLLGTRTKLVAITHVSNALGTVLPIRTMVQLAHRHGARVLLDAAQSVPHLPLNVQALDCDFCVFSGHKLFAPTGIGVLYGKRELLEAMPPWQHGGNMIDQVTFEESSFQQSPAKFEAGTGILAGAVGLGAAIDYLDDLGMDNISRYEHELLVYATEQMLQVPGLRLIGTAGEKASVLSFVMDGLRNEDVGRYLDKEGIAVRAGHHCAQPTMRRFGLESTVRPSLAFYNTHDEVDALVAALRKLRSPIV